ncbi:MAG: type IV pilus assembly protein PilM, partial [Planctomycetia bacterium]
MAKSDAVWGIDIGQCALKALRCRAGETPDKLIADAFDYIPYPKILSQPGADPVELVQEALKQFLSRNTVKGDRVAVSVPGQNGLARFIKLPPVEAKKIPDIVKYEAKQQIPFDLDDVVWDYQRMGGGSEAEGFVLETEVGLFAMKRDQVFRALEPFKMAGIEVDVVQLTPLALYNYLLFDQMTNLPPAEEYMPDDPPPSAVILSLGTNATDLVITNGFRVWQRSIPLGGNHFTKALTKDLKLTFAKAEHLKCHAAKAKDPKRLFQAMRPVFNNLLNEIQHSIGYYTSIDRYAKLEKMVGLGNAMKMPGLRRYLAQSLDMEVIRVDQFNHLTGNEVLSNSTFRRNTPSFGVCYGLVVQALGIGQGTLKTNLLPRDIAQDRFIREKKPWAAACLATVLLGCTIGFAGHALALKSVSEENFKSAESSATAVTGEANSLSSQEEQKKGEFQTIDKVGQHLIGNVDN